MSQDVISVELKDRKVVGKGLDKLRSVGQLPAVIHNHGQPSLHVEGDLKRLNDIYLQAGKHHPVEIKVNGQQILALIKDADFEPVKQRLRHVVFQAINRNEKVEAEIPVVLEGEVPAEKMSLMVITGIDTVQVEALPQDLPDSITVDAGLLREVGDKISVADIQPPAGVTILTEPDQTIARVEMPKDQIAEADAAAADLAADAEKSAEPEETGDKAEEAEAGAEESSDKADESKEEKPKEG